VDAVADTGIACAAHGREKDEKDENGRQSASTTPNLLNAFGTLVT
jgi:hypothetical protein